MHVEILKPRFFHLQTICTFIASLGAGIIIAHGSGVIATANLTGGGGSSVVANSAQIFVSSGGPTNGGNATIFDSFFFTTNQVGQVFSLDQSVDPSFNLFISRLTNGTNDLLTIVSKVSGGGIAGANTLESTFLTTPPAGGNGIDLAGFSIQRIDLSLNQLNISSPGSNPNHNGIWTDYSIQATLSFIGSPVPEPSCPALIITGLGA